MSSMAQARTTTWDVKFQKGISRSKMEVSCHLIRDFMGTWIRLLLVRNSRECLGKACETFVLFAIFFVFQIYIFSQNYALVLEKHVRHHIKLATWCNHCELVQTSVNNSGRPWILPQSDMLFFPEHRVLSSFSSLKTCIVVHLTTHIPNLWWLNQRNACKKMLDLVRVVDQHLEYDFWKESTLKYIF